MSHLQPKFIAKAKAAHRNAKAPRSMPRSMIRAESEGIVIVIQPGQRSKHRGGMFDDSGLWYWDCLGGIPYLKFALQKGKQK